MTSDKLAFVAFEPRMQFVAFLSMEGVLSNERQPEVLLRKAAGMYERSITTMRSLTAELQASRAEHKLIPARKIWQLGDCIFQLGDGLAALSLQLDDTYEHLVRDLGVKRKWLEKVVIFRRYLPKESLIPESLNWGRCEKGTRRVAERLRDGSLPVKDPRRSGSGPVGL